jgi:hypothetical protein
MKAFVVLAVAVACANAAIISPYAGALGYGYAGALGYNGALGYAGALPYNGALGYAGAYAAPIAAPIAPAASQYSAQDEFGNINYGYSNINSAKQEVGNTYGGVTGSYSYVDAYGLPQTVNYVADALGFRVAATNLPIAKSVDLIQPANDLVGPAPVDDTEEVKAAKAEFQKAFDEATAAAAARKRRSAELVTIPASTEPLALAAPLPLTYAAAPIAYAGAPLAYAGANLAYAGAPLAYAGAPLAYAGAPIAAAAPIAAPIAYTASAPAVRDAVLTKIQLNPGHATAYIVQ